MFAAARRIAAGDLTDALQREARSLDRRSAVGGGRDLEALQIPVPRFLDLPCSALAVGTLKLLEARALHADPVGVVGRVARVAE
jgi:hypothetical protein